MKLYFSKHFYDCLFTTIRSKVYVLKPYEQDCFNPTNNPYDYFWKETQWSSITHAYLKAEYIGTI